MKYDVFCKERVFEVHLAVLRYLDSRLDENQDECFWEMKKCLASHKIAIPKQIYTVIRGFVEQYLDEDCFGKNSCREHLFGDKHKCECDLKGIYEKAASMEISHPNSEVCKGKLLENMYHEIAEYYIQPVLKCGCEE